MTKEDRHFIEDMFAQLSSNIFALHNQIAVLRSGETSGEDFDACMKYSDNAVAFYQAQLNATLSARRIVSEDQHK